MAAHKRDDATAACTTSPICDETTPLQSRPAVGLTRSVGARPVRTTRSVSAEHVYRVLPLALSLALAMAATAATSVYAYAAIVCSDPAHCDSQREQRRYAGAVAIATGIANACGALALGPLQALMKTRGPKAGLFVWILCRASGVAVLSVGVMYKSLQLALLGRIFEGFATDNLLQYSLSAIYISASSSGDGMPFSSLMATSLALYMAGMSLSPTIAGMLPGFFASFVMALGIFAASAVYLGLFVPTVVTSYEEDSVAAGDGGYDGRYDGWRRVIQKQLLSSWEPMRNLARDRAIILPGIALLLYNTTQAYLFPALMVFTTLRFSFTGAQNGYIISIAAIVSSIYLVFIVFGIPWIKTRVLATRETDLLDSSDAPTPNNFERSDAATCPSEESAPLQISKPANNDHVFAILSMSTQLAVLPCIPLTTHGSQVFPLVAILALGLAAPSFLKSYGVFLATDQSAATASLAMMECIGALLSAPVLGTWQSWNGVESVFPAAAVLVGAGILAMVLSRLFRSFPRGPID